MIRVILPPHLRTLAQVGAEVKLDVDGPVTQRSVLDALTQEVDKLGQLPRLDDVRPASGSAEVSWQPSNLVPLNVSRADTG